MATPRREDIDIRYLHFDSHNPRLPEDMNRGNEEEVLSWMLNKGDIIALMASIGATGYSSAEAVLAIPIDGKDGHFEVVEGNRRLAAVKLLNDPDKASSRKKLVRETVDQAIKIEKTIPVLIYAGREDILTYLGYTNGSIVHFQLRRNIQSSCQFPGRHALGQRLNTERNTFALAEPEALVGFRDQEEHFGLEDVTLHSYPHPTRTKTTPENKIMGGGFPPLLRRY